MGGYHHPKIPNFVLAQNSPARGPFGPKNSANCTEKREESESLPSFDSNINIPIFLHDPCVSSLGLGLAFNLVWSGSVSRGDGILVSKILIDIKSRTNINVLGKVK